MQSIQHMETSMESMLGREDMDTDRNGSYTSAASGLAVLCRLASVSASHPGGGRAKTSHTIAQPSASSRRGSGVLVLCCFIVRHSVGPRAPPEADGVLFFPTTVSTQSITKRGGAGAGVYAIFFVLQKM